MDFEEALNAFSTNLSTRWIVDQIRETLSEGVSMSRDEPSVVSAFRSTDEEGISEVVRRKRRTYIATRPYSDEERWAILREALKTVLVDLPAVQEKALFRLKDLGSTADRIDFVPPTLSEFGEPGNEEPVYVLVLGEIERRKSEALRAYEGLSEFVKP